MIKTIILIALVCIQLPASDSTGGSGFVEQVFLRTGTVCAAEEAQRRGMSFGDGIRIGKNTNSFELIKLQIHVVCTGMESAKQVGSWLEFRDPVYGGFRAAPFNAGGDMVLIVYFEELGTLLTKSVPSGEEPEEDWTQPEAPKNRNM